MDPFSYLSNASPESVEALYQAYLQHPDNVDETWRNFFKGFEFAQQHFPQLPTADHSFSSKEFNVMALIEGYRTRGHLFTKTNPVRERRSYSPNLALEQFGLSAADLETVFQAGVQIGMGPAKLKDIVAYLDAVYCHHIGIEFMYIRDPEKLQWLKEQFHEISHEQAFNTTEKLEILEALNQAVGFEKYVHRKFVGQKRFSLEGGESLIPALGAAIQRGAENGVQSVVMGMAHRGRLNVLRNVFQKPAAEIFAEFMGNAYTESNFDGDVKYHLGYDGTVKTPSGNSIQLNLLPNPSHLEAVGPVAEGLARSLADADLGGDLKKVMPIVIHGDAAIAGQGVVYELVQMSKLEGYKTGGTLHLVVNNQVGFTTNYLEGRSSTYCTDVAKVVDAPVFHVNADNAEAVVRVMRLAVAYRQRYNEDVFVDLLGYRKHGHNEGDEPRFTQPLLYKNIDKHPDIYQLYKKQLMEAGLIDAAQAELREKQYAAHLDEELEKSKKVQAAFVRPFLGARYSKFKKAGLADVEKSPATGLPKKTIQSWLQALNTLPADKAFLKKIAKIFADRQEMVNNDRLDWALGEALAYASVLAEGGHVRLSGQDCVRGTFSHRHAIVRVEASEEEYTPLNNLPGKKGPFNVYNSLLSEYAVLGFEYGYALGAPSGLTLWEAQFGDFNNGAQIVIDQYISSGEDKWHTQNGLVMLLPHGYEGQGAEHSSARLERFLNLCAELNMQVVNCTSPANFFHALRRQLHRPFRKPLVVMSPKSLLRHPQCVSSIDDFAGKTAFQEVIDDAEATSAKTTTLVFCSGKIYFELLERKRAENAGHIALIRIEQLFPFPAAQVNQIIEGYPAAKRFIWAQEEPENMGAWSFILRANHKSQKRVLPLEVIAQQASASPATGSPKEAARRQADIINRVFETPSAKNSTPRKATAKSA